MSTKIQINSLPALLHLLEAEDEVAVEIRRSVLKEYETKHVLPTIVARVDQIVSQRVNDLLFAEKRKWGQTTLSAEYADVVKQAASATVQKMVTAAVNEAMTPEVAEERVRRLVHDVSFHEVRKQVKAKIAEVLR